MARLENDILVCDVCGKPKETLKKWLDGSYRKVGIMCDCEKKRMDDFNERLKNEEIMRKKSICFSGKNMCDYTFENDDRKNPKMSDAMIEYADNFQEYYKQGKGILLYGSVGTGKSYYAACIANRLIDNGYTCLMTNFINIINEMNKTWSNKSEYIDHLCKFSLLIIDDLGAERQSEYMKEQVYNIIDARYASGKPMIVTTNLEFKDLIGETEIGRKRIYDRIIGSCKSYEMKAISRRLQKAMSDKQ